MHSVSTRASRKLADERGNHDLGRICEKEMLPVEKGDFDEAEMERRHIKVESAAFYGRIQDIGTQLADLVLKFQRIAPHKESLEDFDRQLLSDRPDE